MTYKEILSRLKSEAREQAESENRVHNLLAIQEIEDNSGWHICEKDMHGILCYVARKMISRRQLQVYLGPVYEKISIRESLEKMARKEVESMQ